MTRNRVYLMTGISVGLFAFLTWAFADGLFNTNWWDSSVWTDSAIFTYVFMGIIVLMGVYQASDPAEWRRDRSRLGDRHRRSEGRPALLAPDHGQCLLLDPVGSDSLLRWS